MLSDHISAYMKPHTFSKQNLYNQCKEPKVCHMFHRKVIWFERLLKGCGIAMSIDVDIHLPLTFIHWASTRKKHNGSGSVTATGNPDTGQRGIIQNSTLHVLKVRMCESKGNNVGLSWYCKWRYFYIKYSNLLKMCDIRECKYISYNSTEPNNFHCLTPTLGVAISIMFLFFRCVTSKVQEEVKVLRKNVWMYKIVILQATENKSSIEKYKTETMEV